MKYQPTIGLEIHVELGTKSKMFCSCKNDSNEKHPNINICPICLGHPGTLPVINEEAVKKTIKTGLALNCQIPERSKFDRKNYFYPDLPKGYQISQYDMPFCKEGYLEVAETSSHLPPSPASPDSVIDGKKIRIRRVHLEEDTGKLIHEKNHSLVDFNRAGVPLMELVTEPDITSAKDARKFAEELQLILRYLDVSEADMEKGELRVEANISLSMDAEKLGTKVEIKNLNSFRAVEKSLEYEIKRQTKILESGKKVLQETRGWNSVKEITFSQREKEEAYDYRYFPEPDLPPLHFTKEVIDRIHGEIPELPQQRRERLKREYGLSEKDTEFFVQNKDLGEYFEKVVSELEPRLHPEELLKLIKLAANYLITDLQGLLKTHPKFSPKTWEGKITPENFAEFITLIYKGKISSKIAKVVLQEMFARGADPHHIIEEKGLAQITDTAEIEKVVKSVISKNKKAVEDFKLGRKTALQFLIGKVMAETRGKANPETVSRILAKTLTET